MYGRSWLLEGKQDCYLIRNLRHRKVRNPQGDSNLVWRRHTRKQAVSAHYDVFRVGIWYAKGHVGGMLSSLGSTGIKPEMGLQCKCLIEEYSLFKSLVRVKLYRAGRKPAKIYV